MADNHTAAQRSTNMSHIRAKNTKPEEMVCHYLFFNGYRYRKNVKKLPGCPDIVLKKYKTVIFVNGCFWHKHTCPRFVWPASNVDYWKNKIERNVHRDLENQSDLALAGWEVIIVWECQLKKANYEKTMQEICDAIGKHKGEVIDMSK